MIMIIIVIILIKIIIPIVIIIMIVIEQIDMLGDHESKNHSYSIPKLLASVWVVAAKHIVLSSEDNLSH